MPSRSIKKEDTINSISFFNNFFGEVSSIIMLSQKTNEILKINSDEFLIFFKKYKEGFWKEKKFEQLIEKLKTIETYKKEEQVIQQFHSRTLNLPLKLLDTKIETIYHLSDDLIFAFTPFSASYLEPGITENCLSDPNYKLGYSGNLRLHNYMCYQNKLSLIGVIESIFLSLSFFNLQSLRKNFLSMSKSSIEKLKTIKDLI